MFVDVDAGHAAVSRRRQEDRRSARSAADFQHVTVRADAGQIGKPQPVGGRQPAALPDVFTEGLTAHVGFGAALEIRVDVVVEIDVVLRHLIASPTAFSRRM
ncbi:MAG TPA: hypothetical protein VF424_03605 [Vicinamibacterales bacterium]